MLDGQRQQRRCPRSRANKTIRKELECLKLNYDLLVSKSEASSASSSYHIDSLQKKNQVLKDKLEKLSSEHVTLQGTHMELEKSYEKLVESHVMIEMAHEVMVNTVKSYEPLTHTCTCSLNHVVLKQANLVLSKCL